MSTDGLATCVWFDGRAEEAANYYTRIFSNSRLGRVTRQNDAVPEAAGTVLTVEFELNGQKFVGMNGGPHFTFNEAISFQIHCSDQSEIDHYWNALSDGGETVECGWLKDRFGVSWQVVPSRLLEMIGDPDQQKAARATGAMLEMVKLDIVELEKAYAGS